MLGPLQLSWMDKSMALLTPQEHREALKAAQKLARLSGRPKLKPSGTWTPLYEPPGPRYDEIAHRRTAEQFANRENLRLRPFSWITTSPYR